MTSAPPAAMPALEPASPAGSPPDAKPPPRDAAARRSLLLMGDAASKRLSTCSNPTREAPPTPDAPAAAPLSPPGPLAARSSPASPPAARHKIPAFPPPQPSRVSPVSIPSNRSSWHPQFASSLAYAAVRDFAYPAVHPLHYGPPPAADKSTPSSQRNSIAFEPAAGHGWYGGTGLRRSSDPVQPSYYDEECMFGPPRHPNHPPPLNFSDGPPWSEDEDLQSPVVLPKQPNQGHRKYKSAAHGQHHARSYSKNMISPATLEHYSGTHNQGEDAVRAEQVRLSSGEFYTRNTALGDGEPGGELFRHPEEDEYGEPQYYNEQPYSDDERDFDSDVDDEEYSSRFSRDYQFTIASPDEEMHGKAVALFDFIRENENELPLVEGQVVWVSYRHGMGWLVAEDPKTGESGLVPEEYVRLLRDFGHPPLSPSLASPSMNPSAIISTFSTSSQDVLPYHLGGRLSGTPPPTLAETPTAASHKERIEQIRREQERAMREMDSAAAAASVPADTPRLGSTRFHPAGADDSDGEVDSDGDGDKAPEINGPEREHEQEEDQSSGVSSGNGGPARDDAHDVYWDAKEQQSGIDFREHQPPPSQSAATTPETPVAPKKASEMP